MDINPDTTAQGAAHKAQPHEIDIADARFESRTLRFERARASGRDIVEALGLHPAEAYVVLRFRADGALEDIGLEHEEDLSEPRRNSFFVNAGAETFNFMIDDVRLTWTDARVTGLSLKRLARRVDEDIEIVLEETDGRQRVVEDEEVADLQHPGLERFRARPAREVEIKVNTKSVKIRRGWRTGAEIKAAAIAQGVQIQASFTLSEDLAGGGSRLIGDEDPVRIKGGECFLAIDDHDDS